MITTIPAMISREPVRASGLGNLKRSKVKMAIPRAPPRYSRRLRIKNRNLREYLGGALGIAIFTFDLFKFPSPLARTGSLLIIAGIVVIMIQIYKRASPGRLPVDLALTDSLDFHRGELVRQRDLLRSVLWWYIAPIVPGLVVFGAGVTPRHAAVAGALIKAIRLRRDGKR